MVNTYQEMIDPHDRAYSALVQYAEVSKSTHLKHSCVSVDSSQANFLPTLGCLPSCRHQVRYGARRVEGHL